MAIKSMSVRRCSKEDRLIVETTNEQMAFGSKWEGGGTFGHLYPVDGYLVLMKHITKPIKVFQSLDEFCQWVYENSKVVVNVISQ